MELAGKLPGNTIQLCRAKRNILICSDQCFAKLDRGMMLRMEFPSSNEFLAGKDPIKSHETCDITDYTWSASYLLWLGRALYADPGLKASLAD